MWMDILTLGILPLARLIAVSARKRKDEKMQRKIDGLRLLLTRQSEKLKYRRAQENERLKQRDAQHARGKHKNKEYRP